MEYMLENNIAAPSVFTLENLLHSYENGTVLYARALVYDRGKGLKFNLGGYEAFMPNEEVYMSFENSTKEAAIATRVNKFVCFIITDVKRNGAEYIFEISRKKAQMIAYENYIKKFFPGQIIPCCITHIDRFGVFCDVGYGISALLPIDFISVSRIQSPQDRFYVGQNIYACIKSCELNGRIVLTHKELLGTWLENASFFKAGTSTTGIVRSIEDYGVFIELSPNLAGLAESCEGLKVGDVVNVYIKSIIPDKMKIKLVVISTLSSDQFSPEIKYFKTEGSVKHWKYSTENCFKLIETVF